MKPPRAVLLPPQQWCGQCSVHHQLRVFARVQLSSFSTSRHLEKGTQTKSLLPSSPARTRFAPSPTGYLHLGSLRTALFNYLLARKTNGQFILRIEDTDQRRTVEDAEARLCRDLQWAGIDWDEGPGVGGPHGPYKQSRRTQLYKEAADTLLDTGRAYRCFCPAERLADLAKQRAALGLPTDYDRTCATLSREESDDRAHRHEPYVIRLLAPEKYPDFVDIVYGKVGRDSSRDSAGITMKHGEIAYEDPILLKSDGQPTYHLANVVDDHAMEITHVVRATEWMSSTPKHLELYRAFGWQPPQFAHVGLLVDADGQKLSKRHMATDVSKYREDGFFPEALVNFLVLMGWSHGRKSDVFDLEEMLQEFRMKFTKGNTTVNPNKLEFLQRAHLERFAKHSSVSRLAAAHQVQSPDQSPDLSMEALPKSFDALLTELATVVQDGFPDRGDGKPIRAALYPSDTGSNGSTVITNQIATSDLRKYLARLLYIDSRNYTTPTEFRDRHTYLFRDIDVDPSLVPEDAKSQQSIADMSAFLAHIEEYLSPEAELDFKSTVAKTEEVVKAFTNGKLILSPTQSSENVDQGPTQNQSKDQSINQSNAAQKDNKTKLSDADKKRISNFYAAARSALLESSVGPSIPHVIAVLGPENTRRRLRKFVDAFGGSGT